MVTLPVPGWILLEPRQRRVVAEDIYLDRAEAIRQACHVHRYADYEAGAGAPPMPSWADCKAAGWRLVPITIAARETQETES